MEFSMEPQDFVLDSAMDSGKTREDGAAPGYFQLYERGSKQAVPLKQVGFSIDVC